MTTESNAFPSYALLMRELGPMHAALLITLPREPRDATHHTRMQQSSRVKEPYLLGRLFLP